MPIPSPRKGQSRSEFVSSCMGDAVMLKEFPDQKQRAAVCYSRYKEKKAKASIVISTASDEFIYEDLEKTD